MIDFYENSQIKDNKIIAKFHPKLLSEYGTDGIRLCIGTDGTLYQAQKTKGNMTNAFTDVFIWKTVSGGVQNISLAPADYQSGDKNPVWTITADTSLFKSGYNDPTKLIDGTNGQDIYFENGVAVANKWVKIHFDKAYIVEAFRISMSTATAQGVWKLQGSTDDTTYTDITGNINMGVAIVQEGDTTDKTNTYNYVKLLGVSGSTSSSPWLYDINFKVKEDTVLSIIQDKDKDTKIEVERNNDEDIIRLATAGNDRLIINSNGRIGVGKTPQNASFEVNTNNNQGIVIQAGNGAGASTRTQLGLSWEETDDYQHRILTEHHGGAKSGNKIHFNLWNQGVDTASTLGTLQVLTLTGLGRVGIMTNAPSQPLDVNGNIRLRSGLYDGDTQIGSNGQVLSSTGNKTKWINFDVDTLKDSDNDTKIEVEKNTDEDKIRFSVAGSEAMIVDSNKNIGIGTATPKMGLHVITHNRTTALGTVVNDRGIGLTGNSGECRLYMEAVDAPTNKKVFLFDCGSGVLSLNSLIDNGGNYATQNILVAEATGNIGIGATPTAKLDVTGQIRIRGGSPGDKKVLTSDANGLATWITPPKNRLHDTDNDTYIDTELSTDDDTIVMATAGHNRVIIKNDGTVGIGISPSSVSLDVNTNNGQALLLRAGNSDGTSTRTQLSFGWQETNTYQHRIVTDHNSGAKGGNKIHFKIWNQGIDTSTTLGTLTAMTLSGDGRVGIGVTAPTTTLDINGQIRIRGGSPSANKVLTSDANGLATWTSVNHTQIMDTDNDTGVKVERTADIDQVEIYAQGTQAFIVKNLAQVTVGSGDKQQLIVARNSNVSQQLLLGVDASGHGNIQAIHQGTAHKNIIIARDGGNIGIGTGTTAPTAKLSINGFTQLGTESSCPKIKVKKFTGTTASTQGGSTTVSTGISGAKVLSVTGLVQWGNINSHIALGFARPDNAFNSSIQVGNNEVYIINNHNQSSSILSKPFKILVTYEE